MPGDRPTVSVVIPTLNAGPWLRSLLARLGEQQPHAPDEIILVDSHSRDDTAAIAASDPRVKILTIDSFTHGGARNLGIQAATGEVVILMTQDAEPANEHWLQQLLAPLRDDDVAGVYSRQIPREDASPMERFFLADRFPAEAPVTRRHTGSTPPVYPATFFSNVSSAARREVWRTFPFDERLLMSEDQQFARDALMAGFSLVYAPASVVRHSHTYNLRQTFSRYFDSVVAFRQLSAGHHPARSARLGGATLARELAYIGRTAPWRLPYFFLYMLFKTAGVLAGHCSGRLPRRWCARWSMNPGWWRGDHLDNRRDKREDVGPHA